MEVLYSPALKVTGDEDNLEIGVSYIAGLAALDE